MSFYYAQLTSDNIVHTVMQAANELNDPKAVKVQTLDANLLGKKYENGTFIDMPQQVSETPA